MFQNEKLTAAYWLSVYGDADRMIMNQSQIHAYNQHTLKVLKETGDLISLSEVVRNRRETKQSFWYGICVRRGNLRTEPVDCNYKEFIDEKQITAVLVNEGLILTKESEDGQWYFAVTNYATGWIRKEFVAICSDEKEFNDVIHMKKFLVVMADKIFLPVDTKVRKLSRMELSMGSRVALAEEEKNIIVRQRALADQYLIKIPIRSENGMLSYQLVLLPKCQEVSKGYARYTSGNILNQAFKMLGNPYGWGGMYEERDCSSLILDVYRCFGILLPRNSSSQAIMPGRTFSTEKLDHWEKEQLLNHLMPGSILYMPGHVMLYIGKEEKRYYVISAAGGYTRAGEEKRIPIRSVTINDLSVRDSTNHSWMERIEKIKIVSC